MDALRRQMARRGFFATCGAVALHPGGFFSETTADRSRWSPFVFAVVVGCIGRGTSALWDALLLHRSADASVAAALGALLLSTFSTTMSLWVISALMHLVLVLTQTQRLPFRHTFACVGHAQAPHVLGIVPVVGGIVGLVWQLVVLAVGIRRVHGTTTARAAVSTVFPILLLTIVALSTRAFLLEAFRIPSGAMLPTLQVGDHIQVNKVAYRFVSPERGDVVVFEFPGDRTKDFIKRIVAVGGDEVEIRGGVLYLNGNPTPHEHVRTTRFQDVEDDRVVHEEADEYRDTLGGRAFSIYLVGGGGRDSESQSPWRVLEGTVFVMGDNRDNSHDSRFWGSVPLDLIKGRAVRVWWSSGVEGIRWSRVWRPVH